MQGHRTHENLQATHSLNLVVLPLLRKSPAAFRGRGTLRGRTKDARRASQVSGDFIPRRDLPPPNQNTTSGKAYTDHYSATQALTGYSSSRPRVARHPTAHKARHTTMDDFIVAHFHSKETLPDYQTI